MAQLLSDYVEAPTLAELNVELVSGSGGWPRFERCPVCASPAIRRLATLRRMPYDRCHRCGFTFANPYPPAEVRDAFYDSAFYTNYRVLEEHRARSDPYFSASMYTDPRELARLALVGSPERVLDFGCGTGAFLALLRDEFGVPLTLGLEVSAAARELAAARHGLRVLASPDEFSPASYDLVCLIEVIEHIPNPGAVLDQAVRLLRPGGRLLLTTPAVDGLAARWLPSMCAHYTAPSHVSLFTVRSLQRLLHDRSLSTCSIDLDFEWGMGRRLALAPLYGLDFVSPTDDDCAADLCYRPTGLGARRGLTRTAAPELGRTVRRLATLGDRAAARLLPRPDHIYALAKRT